MINKTIEVCVKKARETGKHVGFKHNDRFLTVTPDDTVWSVEERFGRIYPSW